jgi:asparagine synthase (glutamine-hydrolysing)
LGIRLSPEGLNSFLKYGSLQEPSTLVQGVESLPAGHYLTLPASGEPVVRHYWAVSECVTRNWEQPPQAAEVRHYLEESVRCQLISDVPLGVFLSGGVDSTVIAALAARAQPGGIRTFCIGVKDAEFDESAEAALTAEFLGCQHTSLILEGKQMRESLGAALRSYDQPSYDGINTYFISMLVRQTGIKVALSGLGGDELFIGYEGFRKVQKMIQINEMAHLLPGSARSWLSENLAATSPPGNTIRGTLGEVLDPELAEPYFSSRTLFSRRHIERLLSSRSKVEWSGQSWVRREHELARAAAGLERVDRICFLELQTYLLSTLLRDSDQMSMAHGLELRVPLIDPVLLEHVLPVAIKHKMAGGVGKQLLFEALGNMLPPEVVTRRKRGFTLPFREWMRRDLQRTVSERFLDIKPRGPWDGQTFRKIWLDFQAGRIAWSRVFSLFVLEQWLQDNGVSV